MDACDYFISRARCTLPDLCTTRDLIKLGLFGNEMTAKRWRDAGNGPPYFNINGRYFYPKEGIVNYLKDRKCLKS